MRADRNQGFKKRDAGSIGRHMKGVPFFDRRYIKGRPFLSKISGGSRPSIKGGTKRGRGGGGHPDPEIRGQPGRKKFFPALRASVWSKNKGIHN